MVHAIRMPKPGQMTEECVVTAWHKNEGDPVRRGDILFEIETDKSAMEVESFENGILLRRLVEEGDVVPVNAICAYVGEAGEAIPADEPVTAAVAPPALDAAAVAPPALDAAAVAPPALDAAAAPAISAPVTAPAALTSSGAAGAAAAPAAARVPSPTGRLAISPRASRLAAEAGIDPRSLTGTGPDGRIVERDVRAAVAGGGTATSAASPAAASPAVAAVVVPPVAPPVEGEEQPRPLSRMRRVIADRLTSSWTSTPHFTVTVAVDVTALLALRAELKSAGTTLTVTDFVLAATAQTLAEFPDVNSRTDGVSVWPRRRVHLGVAVSLPGGLVVPVIRDADRLPISDLHERAAALAAQAREGTLAIDDMSGSTFTVSNLGMFGVEEFSAIINPGEAAILAVASALPTAVAIGDGLAVRSIMRLTLSADHRMVDGELGARFLGAIRRRLEDAATFRQEALNG
jgi:pyruvate dehydrogenase E2 component (dihydrolipoamide acetyltransferase)